MVALWHFQAGCSFALAISVFCGIWNTQLDNGGVRPEMPSVCHAAAPLSSSAGLDRRCSLALRPFPNLTTNLLN